MQYMYMCTRLDDAQGESCRGSTPARGSCPQIKPSTHAAVALRRGGGEGDLQCGMANNNQLPSQVSARKGKLSWDKAAGGLNKFMHT